MQAAQATGDPSETAPKPVVTAPRKRRWLILVVALACLAAVTVVGVIQLRGSGGPPHPDAWNAKVQPFAEIVEKQRDLQFEYPVYVDFLPPADFEKQVTTDDADLTDEDRQEIEQYTGLFRALGLIEGDVDLFDLMNQLQGSGIIGYYSYEDERIRIRGTELTPAVESTLVHELTHALQDQHFDLEERFADLDGSNADSAASSAFHALVEGDARRIETAWRESLGKGARKALDKSLANQVSGFEAESSEIPEVLKTLTAAPYVFGEALLRVALAQGGERAVDDLFLVPPTTEEQQLDPWTLVADHQGYLEVSEPTLAKGEEKFDSGDFGAISWLLVLAERIPVKQALTAALGWGGDSYVAFDRDDVSCVRLDYAGDTPRDLDQMRAALRAWVAQGPEGQATVRRAGSSLVFESCDPGSGAASVAAGRSMDAVTLAVSRTYLSTTLVKSGMDTVAARCSAARLVRALTVAQLNNPDLRPVRVRSIIAPCRA